jgi:diguanylate cyclase (GGDEF)-like protein
MEVLGSFMNEKKPVLPLSLRASFSGSARSPHNQNNTRLRRRQDDHQTAQSLELRRLRRARARWINERDHLKQEINYLRDACERDPLTGVYNRRGLDAALHRLKKSLKADQLTHALVFLDGDGFGQINKIYGDDVGDRVIQAIAQSLQRHTRRTDIVARKGGDEFIVVLRDIRTADLDRLIHGPRGLQNRINRHTHVALEACTLMIKCSMGATLFKANENPEDILRRADTAMRANKTHRKAAHRLALF